MAAAAPAAQPSSTGGLPGAPPVAVAASPSASPAPAAVPGPPIPAAQATGSPGSPGLGGSSGSIGLGTGLATGQPVGAGQPGGYPAQGGAVQPYMMQQSPFGQQGYPGQQAYLGQQGYMGQPNYQGQMMQPGFPGQVGQPGQPGMELVPQFNFRTLIRFGMELAAIMQGGYLISMMSTGWVQEMGSNQEHPIRRFGLWVGGMLWSGVTCLLPFLSTRRRRLAFAAAWEKETHMPAQRTPWWVLFGFVYFGISFIQEYLNYRRVRAVPVMNGGSAWGDPRVPKGPSSSRLSPEGDGTGTQSRGVTNNMVKLYHQKQDEMHRQRTLQQEGRGPGSQQPPGSPAVSPQPLPHAKSLPQ